MGFLLADRVVAGTADMVVVAVDIVVDAVLVAVAVLTRLSRLP